MAVKLNVSCKKHSNYKGMRVSKCGSCVIIFALRSKRDIQEFLTPKETLDAIQGLKVTLETQPPKPSKPIHYPDCPAHPTNAEMAERHSVDISCICSKLSRT